MPKFSVALERTCTIEETATVEVEAANAREARAKVKAMLAADGGSERFDWEASDTNYDSARIDSVEGA